MVSAYVLVSFENIFERTLANEGTADCESPLWSKLQYQPI